MKIKIIAVGKQMPGWVNTGFHEYSKRFPKSFSIELIEVATSKRLKSSNIDQLKQKEAQNILASIGSQDIVIVLELNGKNWSTKELAQNLQLWQEQARPIVLIIGGPDGLAPSVLQRADYQWSLSNLTFPHPLVRVMIIEQLYRAWSILTRHPYHK